MSLENYKEDRRRQDVDVTLYYKDYNKAAPKAKKKKKSLKTCVGEMMASPTNKKRM